MALSAEQLQAIVMELVSRPGHEKVRSLVYQLLVDGLEAPSTEVQFERPVPEVRGRLDALLGRTVFEFKRNLRAEKADAEEELTRYLTDREAATGDRFVGIATDGAEFLPYELRRGRLVGLRRFAPDPAKPRNLLAWLDTAVAIRASLAPDPETVRRELGKESLSFAVAEDRLTELWAEVGAQSEVQVKRRLWADLLRIVYGSSVADDMLFFQHTYLVIVAKTMATVVLGESVPSAAELLAGTAFGEASISGAVESDFFDWVLRARGGSDLVDRVARQVTRFRLDDVEHDVLKGLYESLIDPEQRHDLGEYYTPDWLASRMFGRFSLSPLGQRTLDPSCGSGTFLFQGVRRFLEAARAAGLSNRKALERCTEQVIGIDVHPVAVLIARVTYLLAIGSARLSGAAGPRGPLSIPVYLGDSLQWNTEHFMIERSVLIEAPGGRTLHFPAAVAADPTTFGRLIDQMLRMSERADSVADFRAWLAREAIGTAEAERDALADTYHQLVELKEAREDHIWGYVAHNLTRPIWLSTPEEKVDLIIGNPPWLAYRYMASDMRARFRAECEARGLWAGGQLATHQDLSGYFFARCVELYLRPTEQLPLLCRTRRSTASSSRASVRGCSLGGGARPSVCWPACVSRRRGRSMSQCSRCSLYY